MDDHFIINPLTNRKIQKGGNAHRRLIARGVLTPLTVTPQKGSALEATLKKVIEPTVRHALEQKDPNHDATAPPSKVIIADEKKEEKKEEDDDDRFFYDPTYMTYKQQLEEAKVQEFSDRYKGLNTHELKMLMELMSDEIVSQSLNKTDE